MHYFAYGTLLDIDEMTGLCPSAKPVGLMTVKGYELGFATCAGTAKGGCTLIESPDAILYGVQYELSKEDMDSLDKASGIPDGLWAHKPVAAVSADGTEVQTVTYEIPGQPKAFAPSDDYVKPIKAGLRSLDLPEAYVAKMHEIMRRAQASD